MRSWSGLVSLVLAAGFANLPADAQSPVTRAGPIPLARGADLLNLPVVSRGGRGGPAVPDTTSPWRYYPLGVGDVWEYYDFAQGLDFVRLVAAEEFLEGRRYAVVIEMYVPPGVALRHRRAGGDARLRFDTTTARVYEYNEGNEILWEPCPFDAPFTGSIACRRPDDLATMSGDYDQVLVFPEGEPPDTLVTAVKLYDLFPRFEVFSYAADLGMLYREDEFRELGLYYARIDDVEYGRPRHPVPTATGPDGTSGGLALLLHPNPIRGPAMASFAIDRPGGALLDVFDTTGRRLLTLDLGLRPAGRHHVPLQLPELAPGLYIIRLSTASGTVTRPITVLD